MQVVEMERIGTNGVDGQDGYTPVKGVDYWTETEQNEIISTATTNVENNFASTIATIQSNSNNALNTANTANSTANTAKSIAEGANQALSYANYQAMIIAFNSLADDVYRIGQNVMIVTLNVPDLWISEIEQTSEAYTYTTDEAFTTLLQTNGYVKVGYYRLSPLETQKVDLTDYYTKEDTVSKISEMISVDDVQVNGTSIVENGIANVPIATSQSAGVVRANADYGISVTSSGRLNTTQPSEAQIKEGTVQYRTITPKFQHISTFYGLAKAAGDTTQSQSSNPVGTYTEDAIIAIQKMLGVYQAPWELIEDFTLEEDGGFDKSAELDGTPYNFRSAYVRITVPPKSTSIASGYGRWYFVDGNGTSLTAESGRYTENSAQMCKTILIERNANMAIAKLNSFTSTGGRGMLGYKNIGGISFDFGNIQRIYTNSQDKEPAGARIEIYAQRAY